MCHNPDCDSTDVEQYECTNRATLEYRTECKVCGYYEVHATLDYHSEFPCL